MDEKNTEIVDVLGIKPLGEAIKKVTDGAVEGAAAFLSRISLPAAEEFGFLIKDNISAWRANNAVRIAYKAEEYLKKYDNEHLTKANPKLVYHAIEEGSWHHEDVFTDMWAGLLASSCSDRDGDDSNIFFMSILGQLTSTEVKVLNYVCENAEKSVSSAGWPQANQLTLSVSELTTITGADDIHRIDRELDHLRSLELIGSGFAGGGGFDPQSQNAEIIPSGLALHLYVRCKGYIGSPIGYWNLNDNADSKNGEDLSEDDGK